MKQAHLIPVVCLFVAGSTGLAAQRRSNVAGTWLLSVDVGDTHGTPTVVLQQKGSVLTGTIANPRGQQKLAGTVEGKDAVFAFETVREGQPFTGVYRGTVESSRKMSGTVEFTGALSGAGTWVATKK
jgi:hypothetical protein